MKFQGSNVLSTLALMLLLVANQGLASNQETKERQICQNTFFSTLVQLIPCRPAVAPFSPYLPSEACCSAVKGLGQSCLCAVVNGPPISGVDRNMAVLLPEKCTTNFEPCKSFSSPQYDSKGMQIAIVYLLFLLILDTYVPCVLFFIGTGGRK